MGINYSQLPDLHVGDGEIQVVVANADLPKVESWYKLYREDLLKKGHDRCACYEKNVDGQLYADRTADRIRVY